MEASPSGATLGAVQSNSPLADAAMRGDKDAVKKLIKEGADIGVPQGDGMTALHWAALNGDVELTEMLLYAGANMFAIVPHLYAKVPYRRADFQTVSLVSILPMGLVVNPGVKATTVADVLALVTGPATVGTGGVPSRSLA